MAERGVESIVCSLILVLLLDAPASLPAHQELSKTVGQGESLQ